MEQDETRKILHRYLSMLKGAEKKMSSNGTETSKKLQITWKHSTIGRPQGQRDTIKALGLRRLNQTIVRVDNPAVRGMIKKVEHLLEVKEA